VDEDRDVNPSLLAVQDEAWSDIWASEKVTVLLLLVVHTHTHTHTALTERYSLPSTLVSSDI